MEGVPYPQRTEGEAGVYERWSFDRHTAAFADLCADPEVMRFLGGPQSRAAAEAVSGRIAGHWDTFGFGLWAALNPGDGVCLGFVGACRPGPGWDRSLADKIEVGWRLARPAWGRGLATEGARLAVDGIGELLAPSRVISFVNPRNERSLAVTRRLGMGQASTTVDPRGVEVLVLERTTSVVAA